MGLDRRIFWQLPDTRWDPKASQTPRITELFGLEGTLRLIPFQTLHLFISLVSSAADPGSLPGLSPPALSASLWSRISTPRSSSRSPLSCAAVAPGWRCRNPSGDNPARWEGLSAAGAISWTRLAYQALLSFGRIISPAHTWLYPSGFPAHLSNIASSECWRRAWP